MRSELYPPPQRWDEAITNWTDWLTTAGASYETIRVRRSIVRNIAKRLTTTHPDAVTTDELVALLAGVKWSTDYRRIVRTSLNGFYEWAIGTGVCTHNPAARLPKVAQSKPRPRPVNDQVWSALLAAAAPREILMARLAAEAGLRRSEIAKVRIEDLTQDLYGDSLIVTGKGGRQRTVPLTASLAAAIRAEVPAGYLFPSREGNGKHLSADHVGKLLSRLMPDGCTAHKLRHRFSSRAYERTGDILALQQVLGHTSPATTQRYVQVPTKALRAVSEAAA